MPKRQSSAAATSNQNGAAPELSGTYTALITPFKADQSVDWQGMPTFSAM